MDIALYMKNESARLNMENSEREMAALQLTGFFHTLMNACSAWFGTECGCSLPPPDEAAIKKLLCYTLDSDRFGHSRDHAVIELRNSESKKTAKGKLIRNMLFPPAGQIESRYTFLQGRHWLLPLAWIVRAVSNLRLIPNRLRSMKSVAETDIDRVDTYDGFVKFCCCDYSAVTAEPSCSPLIVISLMAEFQASKDSASYSCAVNIVSISPE